jgi:hypothetical protein
MNISRQTASKWWNRYRAGGLTGLEDRPCRPHTSPAQTRARLERRVVALRQPRKLGPARLGPIVGLPPSTVHRVLVRHGCSRLAYVDRPTGRVVRRISTDHVSELVRLDVKKLDKIPPGGGWRVHGRGLVAATRSATPSSTRRSTPSRLAYSEIHDGEQAVTAIGCAARCGRRSRAARQRAVCRRRDTDCSPPGPVSDAPQSPRTGDFPEPARYRATGFRDSRYLKASDAAAIRLAVTSATGRLPIAKRR